VVFLFQDAISLSLRSKGLASQHSDTMEGLLARPSGLSTAAEETNDRMGGSCRHALAYGYTLQL
jgi:hypothetical protein